TRSKRDWSSDVCSSDLIYGKSEKQIKIITEEIRQKNRLYSQNNTVTSKMIAQYIIESELKEEELINENLSSTKPELEVFDSKNGSNDKNMDDDNSSETDDIYDDDDLEIFGELI